MIRERGTSGAVVGRHFVELEPDDLALGVWPGTPASRDRIDQLQAPAGCTRLAGRAHHRSNKGTVEDLDTDERPVDDDFEVNTRSPMNHRVRDKFGHEEAGVRGELPGCPRCNEFDRMGAREPRTRRVSFQRDGERRLHPEPSFANTTERRRLASSRVQAWPEQCVSPKSSCSLYRPARAFKPDRPDLRPPAWGQLVTARRRRLRLAARRVHERGASRTIQSPKPTSSRVRRT